MIQIEFHCFQVGQYIKIYCSKDIDIFDLPRRGKMIPHVVISDIDVKT